MFHYSDEKTKKQILLSESAREFAFFEYYGNFLPFSIKLPTYP